MTPTSHFSDLRPERKSTRCFVSRLCLIKYQCSSTEEVNLQGIFHERVSIRGLPHSRMRCCTKGTAVFYEDGRGLFCLLKYRAVYKCIPLLSGNQSQNGSKHDLSSQCRKWTNPSMFGEADEDGSLWDLPWSWKYVWMLFTSNAKLSYWSNHIKRLLCYSSDR